MFSNALQNEMVEYIGTSALFGSWPYRKDEWLRSSVSINAYIYKQIFLQLRSTTGYVPMSVFDTKNQSWDFIPIGKSMPNENRLCGPDFESNFIVSSDPMAEISAAGCSTPISRSSSYNNISSLTSRMSAF